MENILLLRPKSIQTVGFIYTGIADLPNLIKFVGKTPLINADLSLQYKKVVIKENTVVFRNSYGEVTHTLSVDKVEETMEVVKTLSFTKEHENKVIEKPAKVKPEKSKGKK